MEQQKINSIMQKLKTAIISVLVLIGVMLLVAAGAVWENYTGDRPGSEVAREKDIICDISGSEGYVIKAYAYTYMYLSNTGITERTNAKKKLIELRESYVAWEEENSKNFDPESDFYKKVFGEAYLYGLEVFDITLNQLIPFVEAEQEALIKVTKNSIYCAFNLHQAFLQEGIGLAEQLNAEAEARTAKLISLCTAMMFIAGVAAVVMLADLILVVMRYGEKKKRHYKMMIKIRLNRIIRSSVVVLVALLIFAASSNKRTFADRESSIIIRGRSVHESSEMAEARTAKTIKLRKAMILIAGVATVVIFVESNSLKKSFLNEKESNVMIS